KMFKKYVTAAYKKIFRNESDENDAESATNSQSRRFLLGQYFKQLNEIDHHHIEDHDRNSSVNDLDQIGQNAFELHDQLNQIQSAEDQSQSISIGDNSTILESQLQSIDDEQTNNISSIKSSIGNNFQILNEKFNSLKSTNIDYKFVPVLGSRMNQLEIAVKSIES
ncbi:unnamed protein product, partial [Didymodactylos carnosus]